MISKRWTSERIARLGFFVGLGWDANRVARDPIIASTPNNVHRQAQRFGISFRAVGAMSLFLSPEAGNHFEIAASKRKITREQLIRLLLLQIAADPWLLSNILDDGIGADVA